MSLYSAAHLKHIPKGKSKPVKAQTQEIPTHFEAFTKLEGVSFWGGSVKITRGIIFFGGAVTRQQPKDRQPCVDAHVSP